MPMTDARPRLTSGDTRPPKQKPVLSRTSAAFRLAPPLLSISGMNKRLGAFCLVSLFGVGCGVGDDKVEPNDPNPENIVCTDNFKLTGTFTPGLPARDADSPTGCWPVGTWNFTAALDPSSDTIRDITGDQLPDRCGEVAKTAPATFDASYNFTVTRTMDADGWVEDTQLTGATIGPDGRTMWNDKVLYKLKITEGGTLDCEGGLELYSQDGKSYWNLHPTQADGQPIGGTGDFVLYAEPKN
jgi:hypothetical protein